MTNTYTKKAITEYGFEDARTITIAVLEEQGKNGLAEALWDTLHEDNESDDNQAKDTETENA